MKDLHSYQMGLGGEEAFFVHRKNRNGTSRTQLRNFVQIQRMSQNPKGIILFRQNDENVSTFRVTNPKKIFWWQFLISRKCPLKKNEEKQVQKEGKVLFWFFSDHMILYPNFQKMKNSWSSIPSIGIVNGVVHYYCWRFSLPHNIKYYRYPNQWELTIFLEQTCR